jgi:hypothetical protein
VQIGLLALGSGSAKDGARICEYLGLGAKVRGEKEDGCRPSGEEAMKLTKLTLRGNFSTK